MKAKSRRRIIIVLMSIIMTTFTACNAVSSKEESVTNQGVDTVQEESVANEDVDEEQEEVIANETVDEEQEEVVANEDVDEEQEENVYEDDIFFELDEPNQPKLWIGWSYATKEEAEKEPVVGESGEFPRTSEVYLVASDNLINSEKLKEIKAWRNDGEGHEPYYEYYCKGSWVVCPVIEEECQITFGLIFEDGTEGYMTFEFR